MSGFFCDRFLLSRRWVVLFSLGVIVLGGSALRCTSDKAPGDRRVTDSASPPQDTTTTVTIQEALKRHTDDLMARDGVNGVGQGRCDGAPCIKVFVLQKTPALEQEIPSDLEGYPVRLEETGGFRTQPRPREDSSRTSANS